MKTFFTLLLATVCVYVCAQPVGIAAKDPETPKTWVFLDKKPWEEIPDTIIYMGMQEAARAEFWAQKGIASVQLIDALESELKLSETEITFQEKINMNCLAYQEEYRKKLEAVSIMYQNKSTDYMKLEIDRDMWKKKAKNRGTTIWAIGGAAGLLLFGIALGI